MPLKRYLYTWRPKLERMDDEDKKELKILYQGLKTLEEDERALLMEKYLHTDGKPHPDKVLSEKHGITLNAYMRGRVRIEEKLDKVVSPLLGELGDRRLQEIKDQADREWERKHRGKTPEEIAMDEMRYFHLIT